MNQHSPGIDRHAHDGSIREPTAPTASAWSRRERTSLAKDFTSRPTHASVAFVTSTPQVHGAAQGFLRL